MYTGVIGYKRGLGGGNILTGYTGTTSVCEYSITDGKLGSCPLHVSIATGLPGTTFTHNSCQCTQCFAGYNLHTTHLSIYTGLPGIPITDNPCRYTPWLARYICIQPSHSIYIYTLACQVQSYTLHYPLGCQAGLDISQCISQLARYNLHSSVYSMTCQVGPA